MSLAEDLEAEETRLAAPARSAGSIDDGPFSASRQVDTTAVLDWLGVEHDDKHATCPGCGEPGALICKDGGLKCLHDRCAGTGPINHPGFRSNADIVAAVENVEPVDGAKRICERFGLATTAEHRRSERRPAGVPHDDGYEPTDADAPDAPPVGSVNLATKPRPALVRLGVSDIFTPLPPVPWLVQGLDLCPGAPALVAGFGFSGKTAAVQAMAVEIAAGLPVWGTFAARRGRVLHLDYEQGRHLTLERYQRLAAAHLLTPADLDGRLEVVIHPPMYLDDLSAEAILERECDGVDLLIVDSLRAACPTIEENNSEVRRVLDALGRVSEKTGTTCILIHHARKPTIDKSGGARMTIRGSGAIFDACSSVLVLEAAKGKPVRVAHEKARTSGITADDFELEIADVEIDGNARGGLSVTAAARSTADPDVAARGHLESVCERIRALFREQGSQPSKNAIAGQVGGKRNTTWAALDLMIQSGEVQQAGRTLIWTEGTV